MVRILIPTQEMLHVDASRTVSDIVKELVHDEGTVNDYELVFMGKSLFSDELLSNVPFLTDSSIIRLVRQRETAPALMSASEVDTLNKECKKLLKEVSNVNDPSLHTQLMKYTRDNLINIVKEYPVFINNNNPLALDAIMDFRILISMISEKSNFIRENPHCMVILKKALRSIFDNYYKKSTVTSRMQLMSSTLPSSSATTGTNFSLITPEMLQQALNCAGPSSSTTPIFPTPNSQTSESSTNLQQQGMHGDQLSLDSFRNEYRQQLEQMKEFGFTDEFENIEALRLSNGTVELALQLIIDSREERMDST